MTDLQRATTPELMDELQARFPDLIFAGLRDDPDHEDGELQVVRRGTLTACVGLGVRLTQWIRRESFVELSETEDGDE